MTLCAKFHTIVPICAIDKQTALTKGEKYQYFCKSGKVMESEGIFSRK